MAAAGEEEERGDSRVWRNLGRGQDTCSATSSTVSGGVDGERQCGSDLTGKTELDAARVLADLAQVVLLESGSPGSDIRGNKGRRSRKGTEKMPSAKNLLDLDISCANLREADFGQNYQLEGQQWQKGVSKYLSRKAVKAQQESELTKPSPQCSTGHVSFCGGKSRQNLTEVEREARKLQRILANRESARQTIRRRQALCEELTKKAGELACDNESMKREKELVLKEYQSLKERNKHLKAQFVKTIKGEVDETPSEAIPTHMKTQISLTPPSLSSQLPSHMYNGTPFSPIMWPPIYPPQQFVQQNTDDWKDFAYSCMINSSKEWMSSGRYGVSQPRMPLYVPPYPWFFPLPNHISGSCHLDSCACGERNVDSSNNQQEIVLPAKTEGNMEISSLPVKVKTDASCSTDITGKKGKTSNIMSGTSNELHRDGGQILGSYAEGTILMPTPLRKIPAPSKTKCESVQHPDSDSKDAISSLASCTVAPPLEQLRGAKLHSRKNMMDAAAAANARKRRKEVTKLKSLHGRQVRLPC